jgi:hypothetical protein
MFPVTNPAQENFSGYCRPTPTLAKSKGFGEGVTASVPRAMLYRFSAKYASKKGTISENAYTTIERI